MLSLILASFMPQIKNAALRYGAKFFIGGTDEKSVRKASKTLYKQLPGVVKLVSEEAFVQFCVDQKDKIFPTDKAQPKRIAVKAPAKKKVAKKAAKKVAKKTAKKK